MFEEGAAPPAGVSEGDAEPTEEAAEEGIAQDSQETPEPAAK